MKSTEMLLSLSEWIRDDGLLFLTEEFIITSFKRIVKCVFVCARARVLSLKSKTCFVEPLKMDAEDKWVVFSTPRMETLEYADCALKIKTSSRKIEGGESPDLRHARRWRTKKARFKTTTERRILSAGHFMCLGTAEASTVFWQTTDWSHIFFEDWWYLENAAAAWSFLRRHSEPIWVFL